MFQTILKNAQHSSAGLATKESAFMWNVHKWNFCQKRVPSVHTVFEVTRADSLPSFSSATMERSSHVASGKQQQANFELQISHIFCPSFE